MQQFRIHQIPVLDENGCVVDLLLLDELAAVKPQEAWVVLMAGGLGTRLRPLTEEVPKPLLDVGGKPLLETIVENFVAQGFTRIFISLNYMAEKFKRHFGDGARFGAHIEYLEETKPLGTAGSLSLLPRRPEVPIVVMNGDLLTSVNFKHIIKYHAENEATATMCVQKYSFQIPYGVVEIEGNRLKQIVEKPEQSFFINAGIYVVSPDVFDLIPDDEFFDMPQLFKKFREGEQFACACPIREYWLDIGRIDQLQQARREYQTVFGS